MKRTTVSRIVKQALLNDKHDFDHRGNLQKIIEALPASMVVFDKNLRFVTASDRFFENSPLEKNAVHPFDHWYDLVPDMPKKWKIIHARCLKGEKYKCDADAFHREDGTIEWWRWEVVPLQDTDSSVWGLILYAENITEQKTKEKNLRQMISRLNVSNTSLSTFAHECAHDLCAPLRTLSNYIHLLQETLRQNPKKAEEYAMQIKQNASYMNNLIKKTLDSSSTPISELKAGWFSVDDALEELVLILKEDIKAKKAIVTWSKFGEIYADKVLICQVFQNLIINALNYCDNAQPHIHISVHTEKNRWVIQVKDNGPGIEGYHIDQIFEAYQRGMNSLNTQGLGIGLHICKKIVASHSGEMWAYSKPGQGATFFFSINMPQRK
jgi:PAS domain S-box-containing protein